MGASWAALVLTFCIALAAAYRAVLKLSPLDPLPLVLPRPPKATGVYSSNTLLQGIEKLGVGQLPGPEDVAVDSQGRLYVGCADGWVKKIEPISGKIENWVHVDGRPVGLAMGLHDELIVCESEMGLLNVTQERVEVLSSEADGVKYGGTNAAVVARDGTIYFTDSTDRQNFATSFPLELLDCRPNGRLVKYESATRSTIVLMKDLYFANGVALSAEEDFLVVCETTLARCQRYWLKGEKKGTAEIFIDNLPAFPDNIKNDGKGNFWIALASTREDAFMSLANRYPFLKHLQVVLGFPLLPDKLFHRAHVLAVTEEGQPASLYGDPDGSAIHFVTTGMVVGDYLYLGSLGVDFLGRLKLNDTR